MKKLTLLLTALILKGIDVNLESKVVTINFNDGQTLDDETITKLITDAGYNVEGIHRVE